MGYKVPPVDSGPGGVAVLPLGLMHALRTGHQVSPKDVDQMVCVLAPTGLEKKVHQRPGVNGVSSHLQL